MKENNKVSDVSKRFLEVISEKGYSNYRISREIEIFTEAKLSHIKTGRNQPSEDLVNALISKFPDISKAWLLTGEGDKFKSGSPKVEAKFISQFPNDDESSSTNDRYLYANDGSIGMKVSVVPAKVQAGYLRGYPDPEYYDGFEYVIIPVDRHHSGEYLGFEVVGNSMVCLDTEELAEQSIFPGRIAVGRSLSKHQWAYKLHTHNYDNWIIAHKTEGILIKQIAKHDVENGTITIHSLNPEYEDELLHLDDIEQIFSVVQIVKKTR